MRAATSAVASPLRERFDRIRRRTLQLAAPLSAEDMMVQSMPDASPGKWHLAHTTWFFEQFVLSRRRGFSPRHPDWMVLFNSYYQSVGPMHARPRRGLLSRPALAEILDYRRYVDEAVGECLDTADDPELAALVELGLHHEQQHQELLLTDIKHALWCNPLLPAYAERGPAAPSAAVPLRFLPRPGGIVEIGHDGDRFAFDNETPRHRALLQPHALGSRLVTNAEYLAFIHDGGYREPGLWLSDGWATVQAEGWQRPLYWREDLASAFTLQGVRAIDPEAPVVHVSYFEADAFARWAEARLPTEAEWEAAAAPVPVRGNLQESGVFHPQPAHPQPGQGDGLLQLYGDVWEWTASPYVSYPGFRPLPGSLQGGRRCRRHNRPSGAFQPAAAGGQEWFRAFQPSFRAAAAPAGAGSPRRSP